jgi:hypothetical protein
VTLGMVDAQSVGRILVASLGALITLLAFAAAAHAGGPWRAQVVDAGTGQPLEGVIVVAYFTKFTSSPAGWVGGEFYAADEVVTDSNGRFEIPARMLWNPLRLNFSRVFLEVVLLKPGYGSWRRRVPREQDPVWHEKALSEVFERDDVVLALPPLSREERVEFIRRFSGPSHLVPRARYPRLIATERAERHLLGLE